MSSNKHEDKLNRLGNAIINYRRDDMIDFIISKKFTEGAYISISGIEQSGVLDIGRIVIVRPDHAYCMDIDDFMDAYTETDEEVEEQSKPCLDGVWDTWAAADPGRFQIQVPTGYEIDGSVSHLSNKIELLRTFVEGRTFTLEEANAILGLPTLPIDKAYREDSITCHGLYEQIESNKKCDCGAGHVGGIHSSWCSTQGLLEELSGTEDK